jgi:hypothetical protein
MTLRECSVSVASQAFVAWCLMKGRESFSPKRVLIFIFSSNFIIVCLFPNLLAVCFFFYTHLLFTFPHLSFCCHYSRFHQSFVGVGLNALVMLHTSAPQPQNSYFSGASLRTVRW